MLLDDFAATEVTETIAGNTEALFPPIQDVIRQDAAVSVAEQALQFIPVIPDVLIQREREFNQAAGDKTATPPRYRNWCEIRGLAFQAPCAAHGNRKSRR